jgi:hypothetical protein
MGRELPNAAPVQPLIGRSGRSDRGTCCGDDFGVHDDQLAGAVTSPVADRLTVSLRPSNAHQVVFYVVQNRDPLPSRVPRDGRPEGRFKGASSGASIGLELGLGVFETDGAVDPDG